MELFDILDEEGNKTGIAKPKLAVHRQGLWHRVAHIWLVNSKGEILLQQRSARMENYPSLWDISVAGHIASREGSIQGALREIKEEIGVDLDVSQLELIGTVKHKVVLNKGTYFDNEFSDVYLVKLDLDINNFLRREEEVAALQWMPIAEFKRWVQEKRPDLVPHVEEYRLLFKKI